MMQRRHLEQPLPLAESSRRVLEVTDLQHHGERFDDEHTTDNSKQEFELQQDRDNAERTTQGKRTRVAHEDFGRMRVEPEKAERCPEQRNAEDGKLLRAWQIEEAEVTRSVDATDQICEDAEC